MSRNTVVRLYGLAFILVLSFVAYMSFTHPMPTRKPDVQAELYTQVPTVLDPKGEPPVAAPADHGDPLAYITIPRLGKDWMWVVLEGTELEILDKGIGHFPNSALPGAKGNTAYAGHRATHGDALLDFDTLVLGDKVTLAQSGAKWVYEITAEPEIIEENEGWVIDPYKDGHTLTLVTCWPKYGSEKRMYIRAELVDHTGS